jgi:hypothetical protein
MGLNASDPTDSAAGTLSLSFDGQGQLTGLGVSLTTSDAVTLSGALGVISIPPATSVGIQWIDNDTVSFGFSNPVFTTATGNWMFNAYFSSATYSDQGNGSYSVNGAVAIGAIPIGSTTGFSSPITSEFNDNSDLGSLGNSLVNTMDFLHDNVNCDDVFGS